MKHRYIGTASFYMRVLTLVIPIMVQNGITNFVSMLDNVMVGRVGTLEMTGVSVANQLIFVFNLCIFGAVSGAGIFSSQFFGKGDHEGVRHIFRFKLLFCLGLAAAAITALALWGAPLIRLYLSGDGNTADAAASLGFALRYLRIMLLGLIPYAVVQCYSSTLRETDTATPPMVAGVLAVSVNLALNYILIFGNFGAPKLGVEGAAIATVVSRFVELLVITVWTGRHPARNLFIVGAFRSLRVPLSLIRRITVKGLPLLINETMWAAGIAVLNQCYSVRGLAVVSADTISQTFFNVFSVAFMAVGTSIGIILGQLLGAGKMDEARDSARKLIAFSLMVSVVVGALYFFCAQYIPLIYNTTGEIRRLAMRMMQITAVAMPLDAFAHASYFTLRSGGKTLVTFLFDSCFVWVVNVPTAFIFSRFTAIPILLLFAICQGESLIKDIIGYLLVKRGVWVRNIIGE